MTLIRETYDDIGTYILRISRIVLWADKQTHLKVAPGHQKKTENLDKLMIDGKQRLVHKFS